MKKILMVEDCEITQPLVKEEFERRGLSFDLEKDFDSAVELLVKNNYEFVLCDFIGLVLLGIPFVYGGEDVN